MHKSFYYNSYIKRLVFALLPLALFSACHKEPVDSSNQARPSVYQYIADNKNFSLYRAALKRAGMDNAATFSDGGPFTVFAAADSAMIRVGLTADSINRFNPQALALALKYNIVQGKISSSTLVGFYSQDLTSLNLVYKPNLVKNYYGIFLNGIPLVPGGSIDLNDGVVHQLQQFALPPVGTLLDVIHNNPQLTFLAAAIKALNLESTYIKPPPGAFPYLTVMAPSNDAFKKFGYPDEAAVTADPSKFQLILQVNRLGAPQRLFTSAFLGGYAFGNGNFAIGIDGLTIKTVGNLTPIHISQSNLIATNGVLHIVDQVPTPFKN